MRPEQNDEHFVDDTVKCVVSVMKMIVFCLKFPCNLLPVALFTNMD